jgi:hypothetical protein
VRFGLMIWCIWHRVCYLVDGRLLIVEMGGFGLWWKRNDMTGSRCDRTTSERRGLSPQDRSGDSSQSENAQTQTPSIQYHDFSKSYVITTSV